jgi:hypothetical protein
MGVAKILKQEVPRLRLFIGTAFKATRGEPPRHDGRDLSVKRALLAPAVPAISGAVGVAGVEDDGARRIRYDAIVGQTQPDDLRECRRARALHGDIANATLAEHAGPAQCNGELLATDCFWRWFRGHGWLLRRSHRSWEACVRYMPFKPPCTDKSL